MTDKVRITSLVIEVSDNKSISLTLREAKELYEQLALLFEKQVPHLPAAPIFIDRYKWAEPYNPYWYSTTSVDVPSFGGLEVQCSTQSDSGVKVSYL